VLKKKSPLCLKTLFHFKNRQMFLEHSVESEETESGPLKRWYPTATLRGVITQKISS